MKTSIEGFPIAYRFCVFLRNICSGFDRHIMCLYVDRQYRSYGFMKSL
ncbi:hypothetical protein CKA32_006293 [Geitlerinema sp. FC II]|nr:hypothetical protein CKA32_006293 [Geitlerinema sp. FC II]